MTVFRIACCCVVALLFCLSREAVAHEGHDHGTSKKAGSAAAAAADSTQNTFEANGKSYVWKHRPDLGKQSEAMIAAAKGGLHNNADRDSSTGEIVTVVAKHGLVTLDPEMKEWTLVEGQDPLFAAGMNAHGTDCFMIDDQSYWAFSSTNTGSVVVSQRGKVIAQLTQPKGDEFDNPTVNAYFAAGGRFTPCDVVYLPVAKRLVVVIGYAPGDFALSAEIRDGKWQWGGPAWGGKEQVGGVFSTAHGVQVATEAGQEIVEVASRSHGRVFAFTSSGAQIKMPGADAKYYLDLPKGSTPCNISHIGSSMFLPLLNPLASTKGLAPLLVMDGGKPSGMLVPATYETLGYMHHMHGFCPVERDGTLYGVVLSWPNGRENAAGKRNDGQIAIFEAVEQK
ncbi:hypothetical protein [Rosistilla oblonga]|uniref:hypothetical protein n=1 Tax=Rosistilla oblonga TaxID=2527990 RepID=UPI003A981986